MNRLRRVVRNMLLTESVNKKLQNAIDFLQAGEYSIQFHQEGRQELSILVVDNGGDTKGKVDMQTPNGPGNGRFMVNWTDASNFRGQGVGALLYDLALEHAGNIGLTGHTNGSVKPEALRMYEFMYENDELYDKILLDPVGYTETKEDDINIYHMMAWAKLAGVPIPKMRNRGYMHGDGKSLWMNHPLSYAYVKKDQSKPTTSYLESLGMLR